MNRQVYFTEVEVNPDTGQTTVTNVVTVYDCGKLINPDSLEGQQYGVLYMGLGRSNAECVYLDPQTGVRFLNDNLIVYPVYLMNDLGTPAMFHYRNRPWDGGPTGAVAAAKLRLPLRQPLPTQPYITLSASG
jgi:CO/xanthine dehydrogenase Mo-binding subunit